MNLTLAVREDVARAARKTAENMGKSLNQVVREYLEELAGMTSAEEDIAEMKRLSAKPTGDRGGWKFDRDEVHERS